MEYGLLSGGCEICRCLADKCILSVNANLVCLNDAVCADGTHVQSNVQGPFQSVSRASVTGV